MPEPEQGSRSILLVGASTFLYFYGIGLKLPIFPLWARKLTSDNTELGLVTTLATGVGLICGRPIAGWLMEGRVRRPVLLGGLVFAGVAGILHPLAPDFATLLVLRACAGIGFALVGTASISLVTDLAPPDRRGEVIGYYSAANALSLLVGPASGMALARGIGYDAVFYVGGAIMLVATAPLLFLREPAAAPLADDDRGFWSVFFTPGMPVMVAANLLVTLVHGALTAFLPILMEPHVGWMSVELFFAIDAVALVALRIAVGRRFDSAGRRPFIVAGLCAVACASLALGAFDSDLALALAGLCYGLGFGAYVPAASARVGDLLPESRRARGFAVFLLAFDLGFSCGGIVLGPLADAFGVAVGFVLVSVLPVFAAALYVFSSRRASSSRGS